MHVHLTMGFAVAIPKLHLCLKTARYTEKGASGKVRENEDTSLGAGTNLQEGPWWALTGRHISGAQAVCLKML